MAVPDVTAATVEVTSSTQTGPTSLSVHVSVSKPVELYCVMFTTTVPGAAAIRGSTTATSVDIAYTMPLVIAPGHTGVACTSTDAFGRESEVVSAAVDVGECRWMFHMATGGVVTTAVAVPLCRHHSSHHPSDQCAASQQGLGTSGSNRNGERHRLLQSQQRRCTHRC